MADLPFLRGPENGTDYGASEYFGDPSQSDFLLEDRDGFQDQDQVLPLQKINAFLQSDNVYSRQRIARDLMDCLQRASSPDERLIVLNAVKVLSCDPEPSVKAECMEQLPSLIVYCHENQGTVDPQEAVGNYLLQAAVCSLHDSTNQVRKSAQTALLSMLEHKLIAEDDLEELVLPSLLELLVPDSVSEDLRIETVSLLTKACMLINSQDILEKILLPKFCELCTDNLFHIRKVCAASFGELCAIAGPKLVEEFLLPKFLSLCEDGVWGVRKACAECFMSVSSSCTVHARTGELARAFSTLLNDQSRWVRMAAFQALGPFISTFAGHNLSLYIGDDGTLCVKEPAPEPPPPQEKPGIAAVNEPGERHPQQSIATDSGASSCSDDADAIAQDLHCHNGATDKLHEELPLEDDTCLEELMWQMYHQTNGAKVGSNSEAPIVESVVVADDSQQYNSLAYWREPLPEIDPHALSSVSAPPADGGPASHQLVTNGADMPSNIDDELSRLVNKLETMTDHLQSRQSQCATKNLPVILAEQESNHTFHFTGDKGTATTDAPTQVFDFNSLSILSEFQMSSFNSFSAANYGHHRRSSSGSSAGEPTLAESYARDQSIIPPVLLENYLSMAEPSKAQSVDSDIARHCAFSFPAVAYTLGKDNWKCLKGLYESLASDMQWKVRRTLAFSIHDVAVILGPEATERDLVPIFDGFLKDLDEVKVGVLKHLADFLRLMDQKLRKTYLPRFKDFLETDNNRNWRFRYDLAEQMILLVDLYDPEDVYEYLVPLGMTLLSDRVCEVRQTTYHFISKVVKHLQLDVFRKLRLMLINDLIAKFAHSNRWLHRQMFVHVCDVLLNDGALLPDQLSKELLPSLLALAGDSVPNVRMALSKLFFVSLQAIEYFMTPANPHHSELIAACSALRCDPDRDVRYYGCTGEQELARTVSDNGISDNCLTDHICDIDNNTALTRPDH